jgi:hypothetical protein
VIQKVEKSVREEAAARAKDSAKRIYGQLIQSLEGRVTAGPGTATPHPSGVENGSAAGQAVPAGNGHHQGYGNAGVAPTGNGHGAPNDNEGVAPPRNEQPVLHEGVRSNEGRGVRETDLLRRVYERARHEVDRHDAK